MAHERNCNDKIGWRLREARELLALTRDQICEKIGIKRERLAAYESDRAQLKAGLGFLFCTRFNINERWLATGRGFFRPSWFQDFRCDELQWEKPFGDVYSIALGTAGESKAKAALEKKQHQPLSGIDGERFLVHLAKGWFQDCHPAHQSEFISRIDEAAYDLLNALNKKSRKA